MYKKIGIFALLAVLLVLPPFSYYYSVKCSSSTEILFSPSPVLVGVEANFTVNVELVNCPPFNSFWVTVVYNTTVLDTLDVQVLVPWTANYIAIDENLGTIDISSWDFMHNLEGNQTLAAIEFQAVANSNSTLVLTDTELLDFEAGIIFHNVTAGQVEVVGPLEISVASAKNSYYLEQNVTIHGNVTVEGVRVSSLVGIEVDSPSNFLLIRTIQSGYISPNVSWPVEISSFYPSDDQGNPKNSFAAGFPAYFTVKVKNLVNETLPLLITINTFDRYNSPFGYTISQSIIAPNTTVTLIGSLLIPSGTINGSAIAYANTYSDWPRNGGIPYCPEESATFQIFDGEESSGYVPSSSTPSFQASYNLTFKLPLSEGLGNYSVYVTSHYKVQSSYAETLFLATLLGDFNGDGKVGPYDFTRFSISYGSTPQDPNWFPEADFNGDDKIGPYDFTVFALNYGKHV